MIGILGNLCNVGFQFARFFSENGTPARLIISEKQLAEWSEANPGIDPATSPYLKVIPLTRHFNTLNEVREARRYDMLISVCLGGMWYLPFLGKKYVSYACGADLSELAAGKGYSGYSVKQARLVFRKANLVFFSPDFRQLEMTRLLGLKRLVPWRQFVDTEFWKAPINEKPSLPKGIKIFHPTSLNWIASHEGQNSKGNDLLFKGFRIFLDRGGRGCLYYLRRGRNVDETQKLIRDLGLGSHVQSVGDNCNRNELRDLMREMDVVADQFGPIGGIGLIALEGMSMGKPVLAHYAKSMAELAYPSPETKPPILSASTPEEIAKTLEEVSVPHNLSERAKAGRQWIETYHTSRTLVAWYWDKMSEFGLV